MKKTFKVSLSWLAILLTACQATTNDSQQSPVSTNPDNGDTGKTMYAVSFTKAKENITRYDDISKEIFTKTPVKAWTIRSVDLLEAMGMPVENPIQAKFKHVRMYLGLSQDSTFKLYLTPVEGAKLSSKPPIAGKDVILSGEYDGLGDDGEYMLDFTSPCPTTCPEGEGVVGPR